MEVELGLAGGGLAGELRDGGEREADVEDMARSLDLNFDGVLSYSELRKAFETFRLTDIGINVVTPPEQLTVLYDTIFDQFDLDWSCTIDLVEFRAEKITLTPSPPSPPLTPSLLLSLPSSASSSTATHKWVRRVNLNPHIQIRTRPI